MLWPQAYHLYSYDCVTISYGRMARQKQGGGRTSATVSNRCAEHNWAAACGIPIFNRLAIQALDALVRLFSTQAIITFQEADFSSVLIPWLLEGMP